ncbi:MAG: NUDIX domain-containing protein [bacterium]
MKNCDHKSVGILVRRNGKLLLIERKKFPWGFAPPAGHIDGEPDFESAARRELSEEVGLQANRFRLVAEGRKENKCRRGKGDWHYWKIYEAEAKGDLHRSQDETKQVGWFSQTEIDDLAGRTKEYLLGKIGEEEWERSPGIEPVWLEWFAELKKSVKS